MSSNKKNVLQWTWTINWFDKLSSQNVREQGEH